MAQDHHSNSIQGLQDTLDDLEDFQAGRQHPSREGASRRSPEPWRLPRREDLPSLPCLFRPEPPKHQRPHLVHSRLTEAQEAVRFRGWHSHRTTFNRFIRRMSFHVSLIRSICASITNRLRELLPDLGKNVAVDSIKVRTHSNPDRPLVRDPDASWTGTAKESEAGIATPGNGRTQGRTPGSSVAPFERTARNGRNWPRNTGPWSSSSSR